MEEINSGGICRICLWPKEWLFSIYDGTFEDLPYKEIYHEIMGQPLKDYRSHPLWICQACEFDMLRAHKFRKRCFEAEDRLKNLEEEFQESNDLCMKIKQDVEVNATESHQEDDIEDIYSIHSSNSSNSISAAEDQQDETLEFDLSEITGIQSSVGIETQRKDVVGEHMQQTQQKEKQVASPKVPKVLRLSIERLELDKLQDRIDEIPLSLRKVYKKKSKIKKPDTEMETVNLRMRCDICHKDFANRGSWNAHRVSQHNLGLLLLPCKRCGRSFSSGKEKFAHECRKQCDICNKNVRLVYFHNHVKRHALSKNFQCSDCPKRFKDPHGLDYHKLAFHVNTKWINCKVCGKSVKEATLQRHLKFHDLIRRDRRMKCAHCSKRIKGAYGMIYHLRAFHVKSKKVKCSICEKMVKEVIFKWHLKAHEKIPVKNQVFRSRLRKFECAHCSKRITTAKNMTYHLLAFHVKSKKVNCKVCGKMIKEGILPLHLKYHERTNTTL